ncbi:hypothetical protein [Rhodoferax antarcticus]|uniref:hypothetical protein n=1 Tax=Rhodoferax antarcticus TaxID=81479 RepID=UPI0022253781|nr:hypothetical protein [Rhodoferax antarcticus]MCW2311310.1 hypothetical protein [Rhodoferax antarcticus]
MYQHLRCQIVGRLAWQNRYGGLRLAIGAKKHGVSMQFLIDAVVLSALGGLIGIE